MRITDLLGPEKITLGRSVSGKEEAIALMAGLLDGGGCLADRGAYLDAVLAREAQTGTAVGAGIAVPHAKSASVRTPGLSACTLREGVDWGAPDGLPADLLFMIAAPADGDLHLELLSRLMVLLIDPDFVRALRAAPDPAAFLAVIDRYETAKFPRDTPRPPERGPTPRILAVTACPTGIAHTYLAAEALEQAARTLDLPVKVETQGSGGVRNPLTPAEIAACDGVLVAADRAVDLDRFNGKPVLRVPVSEAIRRPEELLRAVPDAPVHRGGGEADLRPTPAGLYRQLMNGVSHMLPFVMAGGIFIALAFLLDDPSIDYANFGANTPLACWFKQIGLVAFRCMLPVLAGYIAQAIADRPGLMAGFVGGALAMSGTTFAAPEGTALSSGFLGALIAGFAAGYLMLALERASAKLPRTLDGLKPVLIYPVTGLLLVGLFMCLVNPVAGALNTALYAGLEHLGGGSMVALGALLGAMMAVDMGGPVNKAAYLFGTSTLAAGADGHGSPLMAAVMIGGMVPPIAIALAVTCFQNRFTREERKSGPVNYLMGLCFITEGAVPFAVSDPLRVLPACVAGSAAAGALSTALGCALPAPHGGIFVFPVMTNLPGFLMALAAGSLVGMLLLGLLKRRKA